MASYLYCLPYIVIALPTIATATAVAFKGYSKEYRKSYCKCL